MGRRGALLILIVLLATASVGGAALPPEIDLPPQITSDVLPGIGAVSYRFSVPGGADFAVVLETSSQHATMEGIGFWIFDGEGNTRIIDVGTSFTSGFPPESHIEAPQPIGVAHDVKAQPFDDGRTLIILSEQGVDAGEYVVVAGWTTDGVAAPGSGALYATEGTRLISKRTSEGGFVRRDRDFRGLNVSTGAAGLGPASVRPLLMAGASTEASVEDGLYGWFSGVFSGASFLTVKGPNGTTRGPDLLFEGDPPGDYTFRVDVAASPNDFVFVWGVDALRAPRLP